MHLFAVELNFSEVTLSEEMYEGALRLLDEQSRARIRKFYRREDAWRSLIGRSLPLYALRKRGVAADDIHIAYTNAGKPYIVDSPVKFNVSHDGALVVMALDDACTDIGVDVMRCALPRGETVRSFMRVLDEQLAPTEKPAITSAEHLFQLWTLKEAYTKSFGVGLGFDFSRIEYDVGAARVHVDSIAPADEDGWEFTETAFDGVVYERYTCVVVRRGAPNLAAGSGEIVNRRMPSANWVTRLDAAKFLQEYLAM